MITYKINNYLPYKPPKHFPLQIVHNARPSRTWQRGHEMGKLEYALYLKNLGIERGDFVVSKHSVAPYAPNDVFLVHDVVELHRFVEWGNPGCGPFCLELISYASGKLPRRMGGNLYRKIEERDVPFAWVIKMRNEKQSC